MKSKLIVCATIALATHSAHAANIFWADIAGNTNWTTGSSWVAIDPNPPTAPNNSLTADVAIFTSVANAQPNLAAITRSVNGIDFQLPAGGANFTSAAGALLRLGGTGIDATTQLSGESTVSVESLQINGGSHTWTLFSNVDDPAPGTTTSTFSVSSNIDLNGNPLTVRSDRNSASGNAGIVNLSGAISGSANLTLNSPSASRNTINLTGNSSYSGTTAISAVAVTANSLANDGFNSALGSSGQIVLGNSNAFARLTFQDLSVDGSTDRLLSFKGTNAGPYSLANNDADNTIAFTNPGDTGDTSVITTNELLFSLGGSNTGNNTFGQIINDRSLDSLTILRKTDAGTWIVTNNNTYTGGTLLNGGKLLIAQGSSLGSEVVTFGGNATLGATSALTLSNNIDLGDFTGTFTSTAATTAEAFDVAGLITGTGAVTGNTTSAFTKGAVRFSNDANSYSGNFTALPGTYQFTSVADAGINSSLGAGNNIILGSNSATVVFQYVGSANGSTNRPIDWKTTTGPLTLSSNGTGTVSYLTTGSLRSGLGDATLQLRGLNTGDNTLAQVINDSGGVTSVNKQGAGKWILTGANNYSGATTVSEGTLTLGVTDCLADTSNVVISAGTLEVGAGFTDTAGTLKCTGAATINLGTGATLVFADSNLEDWTGGSLNITGDFTNTSIKFATGDGLNAGQLAVISVNGSGTGTYTLDASGYLVPGGGGSAYDTWAGGPGLPIDGDANGDGVSNGLAFLFGAANKDENAINRLPVVTQSGGNLVLNFNCLPASARGGVTFKVEHSTNLAGWTATTNVVPDETNAVPDNNVTFEVGAGPVGPPALNNVQATIDAAAAAGGKLFARLKAENP